MESMSVRERSGAGGAKSADFKNLPGECCRRHFTETRKRKILNICKQANDLRWSRTRLYTCINKLENACWQDGMFSWGQAEDFTLLRYWAFLSHQGHALSRSDHGDEWWDSLLSHSQLSSYSSVLIGFCGIMSIFSSMRYCLGDSTSHGNLWAALAFMPFGLFFDFMDGKVARWRKKSSLMGQELDSLADLVYSINLFEFIICILKITARYLSVCLLQLLPSPSVCVLLSIISFSPSSFSVA